jgi:hypothetical protein
MAPESHKEGIKTVWRGVVLHATHLLFYGDNLTSAIPRMNFCCCSSGKKSI